MTSGSQTPTLPKQPDLCTSSAPDWNPSPPGSDKDLMSSGGISIHLLKCLLHSLVGYLRPIDTPKYLFFLTNLRMCLKKHINSILAVIFPDLVFDIWKIILDTSYRCNLSLPTKMSCLHKLSVKERHSRLPGDHHVDFLDGWVASGRKWELLWTLYTDWWYFVYYCICTYHIFINPHSP